MGWPSRSIIVTVLFVSVPLFAHHSLEAEFDPTQTVTLQGTVTKVDWSNPHVHMLMKVMNGAQTVSWEVELGSPNAQLLEGWKIDTLKPGDRVVVSAYPARDGSKIGFARKITKAR